MDSETLQDALRLSASVRRDLRELNRVWTSRFYEDLHSASEFARVTGAHMDTVQGRLERLERCIREEDLAAISKGEWPVYDIVNYYDRLIDLVSQKERASGVEEPSLGSLRKWRNTAGQFAQLVCGMEDAECL